MQVKKKEGAMTHCLLVGSDLMELFDRCVKCEMKEKRDSKHN